MNRGEMNQVDTEWVDIGRCNRQWLSLGTTLERTMCAGWMVYGKGWSNISAKYATYNLHSSWVEACGNVSSLNGKAQ